MIGIIEKMKMAFNLRQDAELEDVESFLNKQVSFRSGGVNE